MTERGQSIEYIRYVVEIKGLAYCIQEYVSPGDIEDEELRKLWGTARDTLDKIEKIINKRH